MYAVAYGPLAGRIPIIFSNDPVILALGIILTIGVIVYSATRKQASRQQESGVDPRIARQFEHDLSHVSNLLDEPRYQKAMRLLTEDSQRGAENAGRRALNYLESHGVERATGQRNLAKIVTIARVLEAR